MRDGMGMTDKEATPDIPDDVKRAVAALLTEATVARERARICVQVVALAYKLPEDSVARLYAELTPPQVDGRP